MDKKKIRTLTADEMSLNFDIAPYISDEYSEKEWGIIGQPRAVQAMEMAIAIKARGYNLFVTGDPGTGRSTAVMGVLERLAEKKEPLQDITFVYNFVKPENPKVLYFEEGKGVIFKEEIHNLIERFKAIIKKALEGDGYKKRRDTLITDTEKKENHALAEFELELSKGNFQAIQMEDEEENTITEILPVIDGEPIEFDELQNLVTSGEITEEFWNQTREKYFFYMDRMNQVFSTLRLAREELEKKLESLRVETVRGLVHNEVNRLKKIWKEKPIKAYLDSLEKDVLQNLFLFTTEHEVEEGHAPPLIRYGVNVIVDNTGLDRIPIIRETNPTRSNLFGAIESRFDVTGESHTNFMMIKAGSLLRAHGGFIILRISDLLMEESVWNELKRVLETESVELQIQPSALGAPTTIIKPEPVRINIKAIILGPANSYELLTLQDDSFQKLFKVTAEFSPYMIRDERTTREYVAFIRSLIKKENLRKATEDGILEACRYGVKIAERQDLFSTRFSLIADLLRESDYWAGKEGRDQIDSAAVLKALDAKKFMFNLPEEMQNEQIEKDYITIPTSGKDTGSINGLAVLERGFYSFGTPMRITAVVSAGKEGIVNIDREVGLSGEIHSKGVMILEGYLRHRFSRHKALSIHGSICIEQSYSEIEGDSASSVELYALLSAIGRLPLRQDLAATGSVNQFGIIQPVGGITEKVESFFNICKIKGLSGTQGVIIPESNKTNLLPSNEILDAVRNGQFHIYTIRTIDEGLEILTGKEAGKESGEGKYPAGTINHIIMKELHNLSKVKE